MLPYHQFSQGPPTSEGYHQAPCQPQWHQGQPYYQQQQPYQQPWQPRPSEERGAPQFFYNGYLDYQGQGIGLGQPPHQSYQENRQGQPPHLVASQAPSDQRLSSQLNQLSLAEQAPSFDQARSTAFQAATTSQGSGLQGVEGGRRGQNREKADFNDMLRQQIGVEKLAPPQNHGAFHDFSPFHDAGGGLGTPYLGQNLMGGVQSVAQPYDFGRHKESSGASNANKRESDGIQQDLGRFNLDFLDQEDIFDEDIKRTRKKSNTFQFVARSRGNTGDQGVIPPSNFKRPQHQREVTPIQEQEPPSDQVLVDSQGGAVREPEEGPGREEDKKEATLPNV
mmetsp:Transcript_3045/g.5133  ORF Transcript_3045/g.5133 Transcript_3045/m.5133 type:complete len:336 (+) Transcript_3045:1605-2612(+)